MPEPVPVTRTAPPVSWKSPLAILGLPIRPLPGGHYVAPSVSRARFNRYHALLCHSLRAAWVSAPSPALRSVSPGPSLRLIPLGADVLPVQGTRSVRPLAQARRDLTYQPLVLEV